jgi:hypothetical protein
VKILLQIYKNFVLYTFISNSNPYLGLYKLSNDFLFLLFFVYLELARRQKMHFYVYAVTKKSQICVVFCLLILNFILQDRKRTRSSPLRQSVPSETRPSWEEEDGFTLSNIMLYVQEKGKLKLVNNYIQFDHDQ